VELEPTEEQLAAAIKTLRESNLLTTWDEAHIGRCTASYAP
jgi:hypothetical protein